MAPVASALTLALAAVGTLSVDAKPLTPGRHAQPYLAGLISHSKRSLHSIYARYYGSAHGLSKPPPLPTKRDVSLPAGWAYHGCISESWNERLLQGFSFSSSSLTTLLCVNECAKQGYTLAGTEYGDECYCANTYIGTGGAPNADSSCDTPCAGDASENCGQAWLLSLYTYNMTGLPSCSPTTGSPTTPVVNTTDPVTTVNVTTVIDGSTTILPSVTVSQSASVNASISASLTGSITASPSPTPSRAVYENPTDESEWYALGCAVDSLDNRVLTGFSDLNIQNLTIDSCLTLCEDKGYKFAGVEYGQECHCGDSIPSTITYSEWSCDMPCTGQSSETCGGGWGLDLYELFSSGTCDDSTTSASSGILIVTPPTQTASSQSAGVTASSAIASAGSSSATTSVAVIATSVAASSAAVSSAAVSSVAASSVSSVAPASSSSVPVSSDTHYVWAHHMVGNTYPYGVSDWASDISKASSYGIDGFALNMGSDSWQPDRIADAYSAAQSSGTGFKLFLSLDMTVMSCSSWADATTLVNLVKTYASHPNQATMNGKVLVSTFAGSDCTFGTGSMHGWQGAFVDVLNSAGVSIFFVPSIFTDPSTFSSNSFMDGELNWNSAWPMGSGDISTDTDYTYMNGLGSKTYMAAISPFFYTHFGANSWNKNWLYRSDNWLYATRWEQLISMRQQVKSLEILTWNDYGESSYIGPIAGAMPAGSEAWVDGFDHEGINVLTKYYATAFKTGAYPSITKDTIVMWQRPHSKNAIASADSAGRPTGWDWTDDNLYAVVLTTGPATVTLTSGSNTQSFSVSGGLSKLKISSSVGSISGSIARNGNTVASYASSGSVYTDFPSTYNFNYFLGSSS